MATSGARPEPPLVVIVGPTASGKTALAIDLARRYDGEIICADSRTIYRGMDIGTAKPTMDEQTTIPHWGLDLIDPGERFTVADFKAYAEQKIQEIRARGRIPFIVGGTGLYVDAVIFDYHFGTDHEAQQRHELERLDIPQLIDYCTKNNIELPENTQNKRYLVRAIECNGEQSKRRSQPISTSIIVGMATSRDALRIRINLRSEQMLTNGVVEEATLLGKKYGWESEAMTGNVYPLIRRYLDGELDEHEIVDKFATSDWQLAKRQMTWLRRNPYIYWGSVGELRSYIDKTLSV